MGEALDKYTILEIKTSRLERSKKVHAQRERDALKMSLIEQIGTATWMGNHLFVDLMKCNEMLWDLENDIRHVMRHKAWDEKAHLKASVAIREGNEERAHLKQALNEFYGSEFSELKTYTGFDLEVSNGKQ